MEGGRNESPNQSETREDDTKPEETIDRRPQSRRPAAVSDRTSNRMLERRSPVDRSASGLVSRDYQPRTGGPELIAAWPLGPAPSQTALGDDEWQLSETNATLLQKLRLTAPYLGPVDYTTLYLNVCGRGHIDTSDEILSVNLSALNVQGKPYETTIELTNTDPEPFISPMIELTPDDPVAYGPHEFIGREMYTGYELTGKVSAGTGYLDQGTTVQLWSE